jgi:uncharacterized Zn-binding protein involved in type VI secretion
MPPAARITDMHVCPMQTPAIPSPIPHVGGPITGPCTPNVLVGGLPAAVLGDMCVCVGPPDSIVKGSATVMIGGKPAARPTASSRGSATGVSPSLWWSPDPRMVLQVDQRVPAAPLAAQDAAEFPLHARCEMRIDTRL